MEGQKKLSSSSASSFTSELFGSSESQKSSPSTGIFATMFPAPATGKGGQLQDWVSKKGSSGIGHQERGHPCHLSSSLYYGGQDMHSTSSALSAAGPRLTKHYQKGKESDDTNGSSTLGASRGNWWQGSLYY